MNLTKLFRTFALAISVIVPLGAVADTETATKAPTFGKYQAKGFLTDYSKLPMTPDAEGAYRYRDPDADFGKYDKLLVDRIIVWFKDDSEIPGATGQELTIPEVSQSDEGTYHVTLTSDCGTATSADATLALNDGPPVVTNQPDSAVVCEGESVTFSISVSGEEPLNVQWRRNGADIAGATGTSYTIDSVLSTDFGSYESF